MNNKKKIVLLSTILFTILIAVLYVSYAYFAATVSGNETAKKTVLSTKVLKVEYSDGTETLTTNQDGYFIPGSTITKTFTVKNTGNAKVNFSINLTDVTNEFTRTEDLIYTLVSSDNVINENGIFPTTDTFLLSNETLEKDASRTYTLTIDYLTSTENQINDSGKTIEAKITIDEKLTTLENLKVYGNSIQNGTPSLDNPIEIESLGSETKNIFDPTENITYPKTQCGITLDYNEEEDYFIMNGTNGNNYCDLARHDLFKKAEKGSTYIVSTKYVDGKIYGPTTTRYAMVFFASGDTEKSYTQWARTDLAMKDFSQYSYALSHDYVTRIWFYISPNVTFDNYKFRVQLEKASKATDYEPYGYKLPVEISSKNLIDENNFKTVGGNTSVTEQPEYYQVITKNNASGIGINLTRKFKVGDIVSFQTKVKFVDISDSSIMDSVTMRVWNLTKGKYIYTGYNARETASSTITLNKEMILKVENITLTSDLYSEGDTIQLRLTRGQGSGDPRTITYNVYKGTIMAEIGSSCSVYEPYVEPITENIYLKEPLRKSGACDYCSDYLDFSTGIVNRYVKNETFNVADMNNSDGFPGWADVPSMKNYFDNNQGELNKFTNYIANLTVNKGIGINTLWSKGVLFLYQATFGKTQTEFLTNYSDLKLNLIYGIPTPETTETFNVPKLTMPKGANIKVCDSNNICASNIELGLEE